MKFFWVSFLIRNLYCYSLFFIELLYFYGRPILTGCLLAPNEQDRPSNITFAALSYQRINHYYFVPSNN